MTTVLNVLATTQAESFPATTLARISYFEVERATQGFDQCNLLGCGGYGSVYKGIFANGMVREIKVFNLQIEGAFKSFDSECEVLRNLRHRNLTKVITSCTNLDFKALLLEYMPNGSLEQWLHSDGYFLNMIQRLDIMIDVASALEYLHHGYVTVVVHSDLKPSNVLLDERQVGHVSDFGLAKLLREGESVAHTKTLATMGYIAQGNFLFGLSLSNIKCYCTLTSTYVSFDVIYHRFCMKMMVLRTSNITVKLYIYAYDHKEKETCSNIVSVNFLSLVSFLLYLHLFYFYLFKVDSTVFISSKYIPIIFVYLFGTLRN
ncbi:receptor kinase-like protein Xa21 [Lycium barbarum]|uniref:receptor kinase-like protein Xa21 n=1 Tax=Lycium barbarum TaxID=112863 RepID=UPI00293E1371|nr:receptor kinase-like protein Xa21 [Lycium barbarum]